MINEIPRKATMIQNRIYHTIILLAIFLIPSVHIFAQNKDKGFEDTVYTLIKAFEDKDYNTINSFIHKDYKLASIYRIGVANNFSFMDSLDVDHMEQALVITNYKPLAIPHSDFKIKYGKLPRYSCETDSWDVSPGLYTSRQQQDSVFTMAVRHFMTYDMEYADEEYRISEKQYNKYKQMERISRKVYLLLESGDSLVFSLTPINGKWYITIIDSVAGDCSA